MEKVYRLKRGGEIHIRPVSQYEVVDVLTVERRRFDEEHGITNCPSFVLKLGGGELGSAGEELVQYTAATIATSDNPKHVEQWREYSRKRSLWRHHSFTVTARVLLCDGIVEDPPNDGWQNKYIRRGVEIPEDPDELKVFWIERCLVLNPAELLALVTSIQALAQAEVLEAAHVAADTFRNSVGQDGRADAGATPTDAPTERAAEQKSEGLAL